VKRVTVEVPRRRVDQIYNRAYKDLAKGAQVRGFRRGKTPRSVLQRLYGAALAEDVERTLVQETLPEVLQNRALFPVSEPQIEADLPREGETFRYVAQVEVKPPIELGDLKGLLARRPVETVSEEKVDEALENLRQRQAALVEEPADAAAVEGHHITIDFVGSIDGEVFEGGTGNDVTVELGSGQLLPDFEAQLVGARAGEARAVRTAFPEDYGEESLAGKNAEFAVNVNALRRREVPSLDDEFAKDLGDFDDLDALRARVRGDLESARGREVKQALRTSLMDSALERIDIPVPPRLVEERLRRRIASSQQDMVRQGLPESLVHNQSASWAESWRPAVVREIREAWALAQVAEEQNLEIDDSEVDARLGQMAEEQGVDAALLRKEHREHGLLDAIRVELSQERAVEFLLREATVEESNQD
jgi:trigger factor